MVLDNESTEEINGIDVKNLQEDDNATGSMVDTTKSATTTGDHEQQQNEIPNKVKIHFVAVGSAPILKRTKFQINSDQRFAAVHVFLRKLLKLSSADDTNTNSNSNNNSSTISHNNLFLYCCSAFVPSPDHLIGELRDSFANAHTKELVIHYSLQEAWG